MRKVLIKLRFWGILTGILFLIHSCILKEFNFNENKLDTDWDMQLLIPLFYGDMEFYDFVHDWKSPIQVNGAEPTVELEFAADSSVTFPIQLIYTPATIIDSFNFLVEGDDYLYEVAFKYTVTNGSPFPLNLQMRFFDKYSTSAQSPVILPPAFAAANISDGVISPVTTEYLLQLDPDQLASFKAGNRIEFVSWFDEVPSYNPESISAHYPIQLSIVLSGVTHGYYQ